MEAVNGTTRDLHITANEECGTCDGSGAKPGTSKVTCRTCNGSGVEIMQQGFFAVETPCRRCRGSGSIIESPCTTCRGKGTVKKPRTVEVKIPEGVDQGMNLRLAHQGEPGVNGGPSGHLYCRHFGASGPVLQATKDRRLRRRPDLDCSSGARRLRGRADADWRGRAQGESCAGV
ncbi:hypothetical protein PINS_up002340 [Pythium insidiosum]|nr:hypothetical protein PINS_up002340 [Pythium insidiosum]